MNTKEQPKQDGPKHLLDAIKSIWATVGDEMNDNEPTRFLEETKLPGMAGFSFFKFHRGPCHFDCRKAGPGGLVFAKWIIGSIKLKLKNLVMKQRMLIVALTLGTMLLTAGCKNLFPNNQSTTLSRWKNWNDVNVAFEKIAPHQTTVEDLRSLGFDPKVSPNIKILTYVEIVQTFMPNPAIRLHDLPDGVLEYLETKTNTCAYLVELEDIRDIRHGNLFLDVLGFKRMTHESGWRFKGLILIKDDVVIYKLSSGEPQVSREENKIKPLGPFQELDDSVGHSIGFVR